MKANVKRQVIKKPKSGILAAIAAKFKDKVLFPEKVEAARKYLQKAKIVKP